ncbi:MAG: alpha/beta hydrolase [Deltaproteobacteria bacterium]|nr:alpha/beta hydrolase [Deltaproteobacteria bacterium]
MKSEIPVLGLFLVGVAVLLIGVVALAVLSPLRLLNVLSNAREWSGHARSEGIAYGDHPRQKLDVYRPTTPAPDGGWPVVVFFYGGSWNRGARGDYRFVGSALAARGVLALVADYRLYPDVRYPDFLHDAARALAWGFDHAPRFGGDGDRVFVMGHSAGAYNAAMLALDERWLGGVGRSPRALAGFIGLAGPYDFFPTENPDAQPVFFHPSYPPNAQPIEFPSPAAPRSFLAAPVRDDVVSPTRSTKSLAAELEADGVAVTLRFYERASHATLIGAFAWPLRFVAPVLEDVVAFIEAEEPPR